jgi:hypothetical protein
MLCIFGPTRLYKTAWARAHGRHSYLIDAWNAKQLSIDSKYVVLNDIPFTDIKNVYKQLLRGQQEFSVTDKYLYKVHLTDWRKPCIYVSNQDPRECDVNVDWLNGNCVFVEVWKPLYFEEGDEPEYRDDEDNFGSTPDYDGFI